MRDTVYRLAKGYALPTFPPPDMPFTVTFVRFDQGNMFAYYRQHLPGMYLRSYGLCGVILDSEMGDDRINKAEIIVVARPYEDAAPKAISNLMEAGRVVVIDTDDYPHVMHTLDANLAAHWTPQALTNFEECVRLADLVTVSVPLLAERMKELGARRVSVIDNMLDTTSRRWDVEKPPDDGKVRILWTAGFTHIKDAEVLRVPVQRVLEKYPHAIFRSVGYLPNWADQINPGQLEILRGEEVAEYPKSIAGCEISLGPLEENKMNLYRSSVKGWEATCGGSVFVASNYGAYADEFRHRKTGMLCSTDDEWTAAISELIENEAMRDKIWNDASRELLTNRSVERKVIQYYWAYRKAVIQRFGLPKNGVPQSKLEIVKR